MEQKRYSFLPTHPGEVLKDELEYRKITQKDFSENTGIPYTMLNDILNGRRPLTTANAILIESALGISADLLMGLQLDYNMQTARRDPKIAQKSKHINRYAFV